jgi:DNA-binding transcriptional MocR family regulator
MSFTPISNELLDMNMSDGAFRLYCLIQSYCFGDKEQCYPSQKVLASRLRKSVRTVQRYITELIELGLLVVKRRGSTSNLYQVLKKVVKSTVKTAVKTANKIKQKCESHKKNSKNNFNNFQQRSYDMNKLENLLLNRDSSLSYEDCLNYR